MKRKRSVYFHTNLESEANIENHEVPLVINAVGIEYFYRPFKLQDSRKDYSLVYVIDGYINFLIKGENVRVEKGSFIILEPHNSDDYGCWTESNCINYIWWNFTGYDVIRLIENMNLKLGNLYRIGECEEPRNLFMNIAREFTINDSLFSETSSAIFIETLAFFSRKVNAKDKVFVRSMEYIESHYTEDISIDTLAKIEGISQSHFRMLFKKRYNITPNEYIIMKRINSACFYLKYSTRSVERISQLVGYTDSFYFSRVFKKKIGLSPMQYRRECIG